MVGWCVSDDVGCMWFVGGGGHLCYCRYGVSTLARIGRIGPAFGVGGIANRSLREKCILSADGVMGGAAEGKL